MQEAARLMKSEDVGALPIVEDGRLTCVITDRDLAIRGVAEGLDTDDIRARARVEGCRHDRSAAEPRGSGAADGEHQIRRLPVVEEDGRLVGMLAQADVAAAGHDTLTGDVVQKISQ